VGYGKKGVPNVRGYSERPQTKFDQKKRTRMIGKTMEEKRHQEHQGGKKKQVGRSRNLPRTASKGEKPLSQSC